MTTESEPTKPATSHAAPPSPTQNGAAPKDLPPVEPPTARFVVQLFLIPLAIVLVLVVGLSLVYITFGSLATGGHSASDFVDAIKSGNENRRWRAATDLASLLNNDSKLASDPRLAADLAGLLDTELAKGKPDDVRVAQFLTLALGSLNLPADSPTPAEGPIKSLLHAADGAMPPEIRTGAVTSLARQVANNPSVRALPDVAETLLNAARDADPQIRERAIYPLALIDSDSATEILRQSAASDSSRIVRYNAAAALAQRGDMAAKPVLHEMLSMDELKQVFTSGSASENERQIQNVVAEALASLKKSIKAGKPNLPRSLSRELAKLAASAPPDLRDAAKELLKSLPTE